MIVDRDDRDYFKLGHRDCQTLAWTLYSKTHYPGEWKENHLNVETQIVLISFLERKM